MKGSTENATLGTKLCVDLSEGLTETLTVPWLGVPPTLARTLRSTNAREDGLDLL